LIPVNREPKRHGEWLRRWHP